MLEIDGCFVDFPTGFNNVSVGGGSCVYLIEIVFSPADTRDRMPSRFPADSGGMSVGVGFCVWKKARCFQDCFEGAACTFAGVGPRDDLCSRKTSRSVKGGWRR